MVVFLLLMQYMYVFIDHFLFILFSRYIEVFRSTHAEICPVKNTRPTPYSRPGSRGGGYGGYGGYGMKHGSGHMRSYRGRGGGHGGHPPHFTPFDSYGDGKERCAD